MKTKEFEPRGGTLPTGLTEYSDRIDKIFGIRQCCCCLRVVEGGQIITSIDQYSVTAYPHNINSTVLFSTTKLTTINARDKRYAILY